jgi:hypothetical protein
MNMKYLLILCSIFLFGCNSGEKKFTDKIGNTSIFRLETENSQLLSNVIDSISFLPLIEKDDFLFSTINKLIMRGQYIYIMDVWISNSLLVFDETGAFVRKIGSRGRGPKEYVRMWDFDVDSTTIYLYDRAKTRMLNYDLQGNFIEEKKLPFRADGFKILKNRKYLFSLVKENNKYQVIRTDSDFNTEASFFPFDNDEFSNNKHTDNILREVEGVTFYTRIINDTVYSFSEKGELTGGVLFDFGSKTVPARLRNDYAGLTKGRKSGSYNYFIDTPFKVNQFWIGNVFHGKNKATFVYDTVANDYYFYDWINEKLDYTDIYLSLCANSKYIVGWLDLGTYNSLRKKPPLDKQAMAIMEEGGHLLCFYHLKKSKVKLIKQHIL